MDEREKLMLEKLKPERHVSAMKTLATIKYIKKECSKNAYCINCKMHVDKSKFYEPCYFCKANPSDWDEYELTERIYNE